MKTKPATIVTFYSYKGGVGRSMALANVAWLLAEKFGRRVLVVDWDLEAPGLHRFFGLDNARISTGLIEVLDDYKTLLRSETGTLPEKLVDLSKYVLPIQPFTNGGRISILAAGCQTEPKKYAASINSFSWEEFYAKWHGFGFIEHLKEQLRTFDGTDFVLVDSRTGVTDIGGICTLQLPDIVVILFAMNDQNIAGVKSVAEKISQKAVELEGRDEPPLLILRPARVERSSGNQDKKLEWQAKAARELGSFLNEPDAETVMAKKNIPYVSDFSYGETPLAVVKDPLSDMTDAFNDLADVIIQASESESSPSSDTVRNSRSQNLAAYLLVQAKVFLSQKRNIYVSLLFAVLLAVAVLSLLMARSLNLTNQQLQVELAHASASPSPGVSPLPGEGPTIKIPPIRIQMPKGSSPDDANALAAALRAMRYPVEDIEEVDSKDVPEQTTLKYFHDEDANRVPDLVRALYDHTHVPFGNVTIEKDPPEPDASATDKALGLYEIWLGLHEPDIDIELADESQRSEAIKIADTLRAQGFYVSDITVNEETPPDTQVRYFWDANRAEAQNILTIIQRDFKVAKSRLSRNLTTSSGRRYEIWFAKNAF